VSRTMFHITVITSSRRTPPSTASTTRRKPDGVRIRCQCDKRRAMWILLMGRGAGARQFGVVELNRGSSCTRADLPSLNPKP